MALVYTVAGLQTQLDAVNTASEAGDRSALLIALTAAFAVLAGLPSEVKAGDASVKLTADALEAVKALWFGAEAESSSTAVTTDRRRLFRTQQKGNRT